MKNTALITGASSGLGRDFALLHAQTKSDVVIVARREDKLLELKQEITQKYHTEVYIITKDLSVPKAAEEIYDELKQKNIEISYLINNAGFGEISEFYQQDMNKIESMLNLNMLTLTKLCRLYLPDFIKRNQGKILNVASIAALMPGPLQATYYASKAYVLSLSNAIAEEIKATNVTITTLLPGATNTEFGKVSKMENTALFSHPATSKEVSVVGYRAMLAGKLNVKAGIPGYLKFGLKFLHFIPKKTLLNFVYQNQKVK